MNSVTALVLALSIGAPGIKEKTPKTPSIVGDWVAEEVTVGGRVDPLKGQEIRWTFNADGSHSITRDGKMAATSLGKKSRPVCSVSTAVNGRPPSG